MSNCLILDVETTISNKGNPFDQTNKLVCVGVKWNIKGNSWKSTIFYDNFDSLQEIINRADLIVGFNIKFDLHWLRRIGIDISKIKVWDCQLAEFILSNQQNKYPSLDGAAEKYGFDKKLDIVKTEYWDKGIDTDQIPRNILSDYLNQDLILTEQVYLKQVEQFKSNGLLPLFRLQCADLLVLEEMEYNGIYFNTEKARKHAGEIELELDVIRKELSKFTNNIAINLNSNDHVSCLIYGGSICVDDKIPIGVFKSGDKKGQVKYKNIVKEYPLPRLVEPLKGTETKKSVEGRQYWEVNETVLRKLKLNKQAKVVVDLLNKYSELEKLRGTYLNGYSDLIDTMNWPANMLHGVLNQCVAVTGRLSSSRPNLQNTDPKTKIYMETIYEN
jgi:DNA polymerase I-like protein with 3'-5' exonuclease and polymerase domains